MQQAQRDLARQDLYESMQALVWGTELGDDLSETLKAACNQKLNVSPQRGHCLGRHSSLNDLGSTKWHSFDANTTSVLTIYRCLSQALKY